MFNVLVSGGATTWETDGVMKSPTDEDRFLNRCGHEVHKHSVSLDSPSTLKVLENIPTFLMYESVRQENKTVHFGMIHNTRVEPGEVAFDFLKLGSVDRQFIWDNRHILHIDDRQFSRNLWTVKDGVVPSAILEKVFPSKPNMIFKVGLSFPNEVRDYVRKVASYLSAFLGESRILYDEFHSHEFAVADLDTHLQRLYREECELIVVILGESYAGRYWCQLEWRAIRAIIESRKKDIMFFKFDDGKVDGIYENVGTIDIRRDSEEIAMRKILKRLLFGIRLSPQQKQAPPILNEVAKVVSEAWRKASTFGPDLTSHSIDLLRQLVVGGAEQVTLIKHFEGNKLKVVRGKNIILRYDGKHVEEDLEELSNAGLLKENTGAENRSFVVMRKAHDWVKENPA